MKFRTLFNQQFTGYIATLLVGAVGVTTATAAMAQPSTKKVPVQVAQSSAMIIGNWRLSNMTESSAPTPMLPSADLTAEFAGDRITGSGGCNRFNGSYRTQRNQLSIGPLATTFMACESGLMTQESRYLKALQGAQRYEVLRPGELTIFYRTDRESGTLRYLSQNSNPGGNPGGNPGNQGAQTTFPGRGVAQGSAFTKGRNATASLTSDRDNFALELSERGGRARVQYRGVGTRRTNGSAAGSFTLDGRVRTFTSSADSRVLGNTTGTCRIEVVNSLVISSSCRTATADSSTQFLGLEQF